MELALGRAAVEAGLGLERRAGRALASGEGRAAASGDPAALVRAAARGGGFANLFPPSRPDPVDPDQDRRLAALAEALADADMPGAGAARPGATPPGPVWAVISRLVEHDLAALVDAAPRFRAAADAPGRGAGLGLEGGPRDAAATEAALVNLRDGRLRLTSLYEPDAGPGPLADRLRALMREPQAEARLRLDRPEGGPAGAAGADLPRLARLAGPDLAAAMARAGTASGWSLVRPADRSAAVIGDRRNDADLAASQMHVAMIGFHNRVVDWLAETGGAPADRLFDQARRLVVWHGQWLALNVWLPRLCDPRTLARVRRAGAPAFRRMVARRRRAGALPGGALPAPLETWCAAAHFRQTLERARYDLNPGLRRAPAELLRRSGGAWLEGGRLPAARRVDWALWMDGPAAGPDAVALDTRLAPEPGFARAQAARALRTLRRGAALNLPSAQDCVAGFATLYSDLIRPLSPETLCGGHTGQALRDGLAERTPIWAYVLREAETLGRGERLGPLGSALMAEAVIGALACDPESVWNRPGRGGGRWSPDLGARPDGVTVDSLEAFFAAAGTG